MSDESRTQKDSDKRRPGLVPTVGAYFVIALITILTIGLIVSRSLSNISELASRTQRTVLPEIVERQRTAVNLERLGRFAETIYRADDPRVRRQFKLAARILSQDSVFEKDQQVAQIVQEAYRNLDHLADIRDMQDQAAQRSMKIFLDFAPGKPFAHALAGQPRGAQILDLLFNSQLMTTLNEINEAKASFAKLSGSTQRPDSQSMVAAWEILEQHRIAIESGQQSRDIWESVNESLDYLSDNLSIGAAITADDSFTTISLESGKALQTGLLAAVVLLITLLLLLFLAQRDIVVPIIRYVQVLNKAGKGDIDPTLPEARLRELDDIRRAVERSLTLVTQLGNRTDALETANKALEQEIEEKEKVQQELAGAKEKAEAADRAKSEFLAGMSHEIRTPMNTILGMADLMLETEPTTEQRQYIEIFQSSGEMLLNIINDVLDLSKIEAGEIELEAVPIDMKEFVDRTREVVSGRAVQKGLDFLVDIAPSVPPRVIGDPNRLRQVLVNLIDNGVKFTDSGSVTLSITTDPDVPGRVTFAVTDTGIGVAKESQAQIFQRFTQADASTTRKYGGTGLGLSICARLVSLMGGTIKVQSVLDEGATFHFTIDFPLPTEDAPGVTTRPKEVGDLVDALKGRTVNILVAEDSDSNQALIELYFRNTDCRLTFASDGAEAIEKFANSEYDLVLMDIQMPVMDGYEATRGIRRLENRLGRQSVPIVAVTANAFREDQQRCMEAGCTDYLAKPISKAGLLQCVSRHIDG